MIDGGDSDTVTVYVDALEPGLVEGTINILSNDPAALITDLPFTIDVTTVNYPPGAFNLASPADDDTIFITPDNIGNSFIFAWSAAVDPNEDPVSYIFSVQSAELEDDEFDTTVTAFFVDYQEIYDDLADAGAAIATIVWNVHATDGIDTIPSANGPWTLTFDVSAVGIDDGLAIPDVFALRQNYPNPFNPVTTIAYDIPERSEVRIDVFNIRGQKVRTLVAGYHEPGFHRARWNSTNNRGMPLASGMYIYRIVARSPGQAEDPCCFFLIVKKNT